jgi:hypothetical protein
VEPVQLLDDDTAAASVLLLGLFKLRGGRCILANEEDA